MLKGAKKNLLQQFNMGIKNAEFHADFKSIEKVLQKCTKKREGNMHFFTLLMFIKLVLLTTLKPNALKTAPKIINTY